jgi:hypothetical protein
MVQRCRVLWIALLFSVLLSGVFPFAANATLSVVGATVDIEVSPGATYKHTMLVNLGENDSATDMQVRVEGLGQQLDGVTKSLPPHLDTSPYSARSFISLDRSSFRVEPGSARQVNALINVPAGVGSGGRYAIIRIYTVPTGGGMLTVSQGIAVPVKLTIKDSGLTHTGEISNLTVGSVEKGRPVSVSVVFKNTGNHHFKIKGEARITDAQGLTRATADIPLTAANVIPTMSRQLQASLTPAGELLPGAYTVHAKVVMENGTAVAETAKSFTVYPRVTFSDTKGHWAQGDIEIMAGLGYVKGMGNNKFEPNARLTRAQFAAFLIRCLDIPETKPAVKNFKDVYTGAWYYGAVETAFANGLVHGYGDGRFKPNAYITREELAAMVVRGLEKGGKQVVVPDVDGLLAQFIDEGRIGAWARQAAAAAVQEELLRGLPGNKFAPKDNATRAEAVVMLKRMKRLG